MDSVEFKVQLAAFAVNAIYKAIFKQMFKQILMFKGKDTL